MSAIPAIPPAPSASTAVYVEEPWIAAERERGLRKQAADDVARAASPFVLCTAISAFTIVDGDGEIAVQAGQRIELTEHDALGALAGLVRRVDLPSSPTRA